MYSPPWHQLSGATPPQSFGIDSWTCSLTYVLLVAVSEGHRQVKSSKWPRATQSFTVGEPVYTHVKVPESNSLSQITFFWGPWKSELFSKAANAESFVDQPLPWQPGLSALILCFLFLAPTHCCFPSLISHKHLHHFLTFYQVHVCHWPERAPKILGNILLHPWLH